MDAPADSTPSVAVIGGGFSGLAAALRLADLSKQAGRRLSISVFDPAPHAGGLVRTDRIGDYLVERGADSFITNKPGAIGLCRRLGLEDRLIGTNPDFRKSFILKDGKPVATPTGFQLLAPTRLRPFLESHLLSWKGKLRVMGEWFIPARHNVTDESLGDFVRRRFGSEILDRIVQPLVGGIYTSDPERLSLAATMPRFLEMERVHGSLLRALPRDESTDQSASGARYGMFATLPGGLSELIDTLTAELKRSGVEFVSSPATEVSPATHADGTRWRVESPAGCRSFDGTIVSLPAFRAADLLRSWNEPLADKLNEIEYASSAIVLTGHKFADITHPLDGAGLVIPHRENRRIIAVSFASRKFPGRAPQGRALLRTFVGGAMQPDMLNFGDGDLKRIVREELSELLGVGSAPDFEEVVRYDRGMPQYHVGHLDRVAKIDELCAQQPAFALCGNAYRGIGIPDAIESGTQAAERVWKSLVSRPATETSPVKTT